jgi:hypothetical protein
MEIKNTRNLGLLDAAEIELKETNRAANASEFKLRVVDGKVTEKEISHMLTLARVSKNYKNNAANYQFKLKSDGNGQYLTLKQQGAWSSFKGLFGVGHTAREKERAAAKNLINGALRMNHRPEKSYQSDKYDNQISHKQAKKYQVSLMNTSGISPTMTQNLEHVGRGPLKAKKSEELTMSMLAAGNAPVIDRQSMGNPSYQVYDPNEETESQAIVPQNVSQQNAVGNHAHNSYMPVFSHQHESISNLSANNGLAQYEEVENEQTKGSFVEKNRESADFKPMHNFLMGLMKKQESNAV